jgi:hypothetical protein
MRSLLLCWVLCWGVVAFGADDWKWIKATNTTEGWSVSQGQAEVVISGDHFEVRLFSDSGKELVSSLKGAILRGKITAKERISASDFSGSTYRGTFARKAWPEFAGTTGAEAITLSDGWGMIGLRKNVQK